MQLSELWRHYLAYTVSVIVVMSFGSLINERYYCYHGYWLRKTVSLFVQNTASNFNLYYWDDIMWVRVECKYRSVLLYTKTYRTIHAITFYTFLPQYTLVLTLLPWASYAILRAIISKRFYHVISITWLVPRQRQGTLRLESAIKLLRWHM